MDSLLRYIRTLTPFTDASWALLQGALTLADFKKNQPLLQHENKRNTLFFIEAGYCRSYIEMEGVEKNMNFFFENEIAALPLTAANCINSSYNIVACEKVSAILLDKDKLGIIAQEAPEIERMGRHFIYAFASKVEEFSNLTKHSTTLQLLEHIEKKHPYMIQRIPLTQLASFLGVTRETLSRIRKQRFQR